MTTKMVAVTALTILLILIRLSHYKAHISNLLFLIDSTSPSRCALPFLGDVQFLLLFQLLLQYELLQRLSPLFLLVRVPLLRSFMYQILHFLKLSLPLHSPINIEPHTLLLSRHQLQVIAKDILLHFFEEVLVCDAEVGDGCSLYRGDTGFHFAHEVFTLVFVHYGAGGELRTGEVLSLIACSYSTMLPLINIKISIASR